MYKCGLWSFSFYCSGMRENSSDHHSEKYHKCHIHCHLHLQCCLSDEDLNLSPVNKVYYLIVQYPVSCLIAIF